MFGRRQKFDLLHQRLNSKLNTRPGRLKSENKIIQSFSKLTSDGLNVLKSAINYDSVRESNSFVFSVFTGLIFSINVSIENKVLVINICFTEQVILFPGSEF